MSLHSDKPNKWNCDTSRREQQYKNAKQNSAPE